MMPMPSRMLSSMVVRLNGKLYLFDAGEGTQIGWKRARMGLRGFSFVAVTHLHADHCLGLPGMLMLRTQIPDPGPLTVLGPPGIEEFIFSNRRIMDFHLNYPIQCIEWKNGDDGPAYRDEQVIISWAPLRHTRFCLGYRLEEVSRPGRFDSAAAEALEVEKGPLWGTLQHGKCVVNRSGETVSPEMVLGPRRKGRSLAYVVDTRPTENISRLCRDVDIAFLEGMFLPEDGDHAEAKGHLSVTEAAEIAAASSARRVVLTHLSPRYKDDDIERMEFVARAIHEPVEVGRELRVYDVPRPD